MAVEVRAAMRDPLATTLAPPVEQPEAAQRAAAVAQAVRPVRARREEPGAAPARAEPRAPAGPREPEQAAAPPEPEEVAAPRGAEPREAAVEAQGRGRRTAVAAERMPAEEQVGPMRE